MVIHFPTFLKKKRERESGITEEDKRYVYSHPPDKLPHERLEEQSEREEYIRSVTQTDQFSDYCQIDHYGNRQSKRKKSVFDKLMR